MIGHIWKPLDFVLLGRCQGRGSERRDEDIACPIIREGAASPPKAQGIGDFQGAKRIGIL